MNQNFAKNLIRGKIGEVIFDRIFREEEKFIVIPFGYENVLPELTQHVPSLENN